MKKPFPVQAYVISCLRKVFGWYPPKAAAKAAAQRGKDQYACALCPSGALHPRKSIVIDHISPVVDVKKGWQGYDSYVERLFCPIENLQAVCKVCHNAKSKRENAERRKQRRSK